MRNTKAALALIIAIFFYTTASASDEHVDGVWVKTTHPDPKNISIFYVENDKVKAIGYGHITNKPAIWFAEGRIWKGLLTLKYRYSPNAIPAGWERKGTMQLKVSKDGAWMSGSARSISGGWTGRVEFKRMNRRPS